MKKSVLAFLLCFSMITVLSTTAFAATNLGTLSNTYDDGTILLVIVKDTVTVNNSYVIGFSPVNDESLIYTQATETSIYPVSDELLTEISEYQID